MPTVLQNYKLAIQAMRPTARLTIKKDTEGSRFYRIVDRDNALTGWEVSPTIAWRETEFFLLNNAVDDI